MNTSLPTRLVRPLARVLRLSALVLLAALSVGRAAAQTAPAGNAHPETQNVSDLSGVNPFGEPSQTTFTSVSKRDFAAKVDLEPLRDLAVFHDGRLKIVDTLARETVKDILGRKDFADWIAKPEAGPHATTKVAYDPLFTFFDLIIDPAFYGDKAIIHVEYLPLRADLLTTRYTGDEHEWWKRLGRLTPELVMGEGGKLAGEHQFDEPYRKGLYQVSSAMNLYRLSWQNLLMVAPPTREAKWSNLSAVLDGSKGADLKAAVQNLGEGWRAGDAARVNDAVRTLAAGLPKVNAELYPTTRREVEHWYNATNPFEWGYWLYCLALINLILAFGTGRRTLVAIGITALVAALGFHIFGFAARCYIAERLAIQNQFESMTGLSLGAALVGFTVMVLRRQWLFGAAAAGVGFMVLITATQTAIPGQVIEREAPILNTSILLKYHVTTVLVSYGLISLGFMVSLFYMGTYYADRFRARVSRPALAAGGAAPAMFPGGAPHPAANPAAQPSGMFDLSASALGLDENAPKGPQRLLSDLDKAQMIILQLAFWTLGVGILLGAWWADHSWGRWWAFDPKELWALITWIVYLIVLHVRFGVKDRGWWTALLSIIGFFVMLWTYFGVNLLLPGLHAYA